MTFSACLLFYCSHCEGKMCVNTFAVENSDQLKEENTNQPCFFFKLFFILCILNYRAEFFSQFRGFQKLIKMVH